MRSHFAIPVVSTLLTLAIFGCSTSETKKANPNLTTSTDDLSGKTFSVAFSESMNSNMKAVEVSMIFQDTTGVFRGIEGSSMHQSNFTWQFVGDSLAIQFIEDPLKVEGKKPHYTPQPMKYAVVKEHGGFLLTGKTDQMVLSEKK